MIGVIILLALYIVFILLCLFGDDLYQWSLKREIRRVRKKYGADNVVDE